MHIRDRVKELRRVRAAELIPNPKNWRMHPARQQDALRGILAEVGYADALLARETAAGLMLIDGHLRAETTPDAIVPVLVLDVDEAEADKLLATLDPLAALAETDGTRLDSLLAEIKTQSAALGEMLAGLAAAANSASDHAAMGDAAAGAQADESAGAAAPELPAKYAIVIHCETEQEQLALLERFEQEGLPCRALVV
jgi:hypothetical protein